MTPLARVAGAVALGGLLAGAQLLGLSLATKDLPVSSAPLALDDYCRHLHGERSAAYQPSDLGGWRCSVWRNGVWGLDLVDLGAACRWQHGDQDANLELPDEAGQAPTRRRLLCTK